MLSESLLKRLFPTADDANITAFAAQSGTLLPKFGISDKRNRLHFFLAQLGHESGGLRAKTESLNYSVAGLKGTFSRARISAADCERLGRKPGEGPLPTARQTAIANLVYGGSWGRDNLGNTQPNDGWTYRGRGYIQITGRDGYHQIATRTGLDLVGQPDLAPRPEQALAVACAVWDWKKVNPAADAGDFVKATKLINGGTIGLHDRFEWLNKVQSLVSWPLTGQVVEESAEVALPLARRKAVQTKLKELDLYAGSIDGIIGTNTRKGLKIFQTDHNLPANGLITAETLAALGV